MINLVIITGISGSGKSTALKAFEDLGYLAIDNFPIRLLPQFLKEVKESLENRNIALVIDLRDRYFLKDFKEIFEKIKQQKHAFELLFLDAKTDVIITRYNQTRRIHPLMKEGVVSLQEAIEKERKLLIDLREIATFTLDTSNFNIHQLRNEIFKLYKKRKNLKDWVLHLIAFGYKYGIPAEANFLFDVRMLPNPYFVPDLKPLTGRDLKIKNYLLDFKETKEFMNYLESFFNWLIPYYYQDDKHYLTVGIGCTGGRHRSPAIADFLADKLKEKYPQLEIVVTYRDIEKDVKN
jgi:UPF0042 nucleotide-binding protein